MITRKFLESLLLEKDFFTPSSGHVYKLNENVYSFTEFNFLSGGDVNGLDGHYTFVVNIENFKYVVYKYANYSGNLISVNEIENKVFLTIDNSIKAKIESFIAHKLLRTCVGYDVKPFFINDNSGTDSFYKASHMVDNSIYGFELKDIDKLSIEVLTNN